MKTVVLVRGRSYKWKDQAFEKNIPANVDDAVSKELLKTGHFQLREKPVKQVGKPEGGENAGTDGADAGETRTLSKGKGGKSGKKE